MNALDALGLAYEDDSDDDEDEVAPAQCPPAVPVASAPAPAALSMPPIAAALPDAGALGLPDEDDWSGHVDAEDEPVYDPVGTKYNAVAVPTSISKASEDHNSRAGCGKRSGPSHSVMLALKEGLSASTSGIPASRPMEPPKVRTARAPTGVLLPPQVRPRAKPNVTTEELSNMRSAKRPKSGGSLPPV